MSDAELPPQTILDPPHLAVVGLVIVAQEMEKAVEGEDLELPWEGRPEAARLALGRLHRDDDVPEVAPGAALPGRPEGEHVRRLVEPAEIPVQRPHSPVGHERDRGRARGGAGGGSDCPEERPEPAGVDRDPALQVPDRKTRLFGAFRPFRPPPRSYGEPGRSP